MDLTLMRVELTRDEGRRTIPYRDQFGNWTWGVGHDLDEPISKTALLLVLQGNVEGAVDQTLNDDIGAAILALTGKFPWFHNLDEVRQRTMCNLCFQLGIEGLLEFTTFLGLMQLGRYDAAADDLAQTKLARETPERCQREIEAIRTGSTQ